MLEMAVRNGLQKIYVHALLDGRDTPPRSAEHSLQRMQDNAPRSARDASPPSSGVSSRWTGITAGTCAAAYDLLTQGKAPFSAATAVTGLQQAYARDENDEFIQATVIGEKVGMQDGDVAVFMNFRARPRTRTYPRADRHRVRRLQP